MKRHLIWLVFFGALFLISCAPGPNTLTHTINTSGHIAGFWLGLWHGMISPITLIVSLFNHNVNIYEIHNNGGWYNWGFLMGCVSSMGGGSAAVRRR